MVSSSPNNFLFSSPPPFFYRERKEEKNSWFVRRMQIRGSQQPNCIHTRKEYIMKLYNKEIEKKRLISFLRLLTRGLQMSYCVYVCRYRFSTKLNTERPSFFQNEKIIYPTFFFSFPVLRRWDGVKEIDFVNKIFVFGTVCLS